MWTSEHHAYRSKISARAGFTTHLFYLARNDFLQLRMSVSAKAAEYLESRLKVDGHMNEWVTHGEDVRALLCVRVCMCLHLCFLVGRHVLCVCVHVF